MFFGGMPFDFGGGIPGGRSGFSGRPEPAVDNEKFYKVLGVEKDADLNAIKKAYRKLALACHPDRGGDAEKFKEVSVAYETLSDPEKRKAYDLYGEEGAERGAGGMDFMSAMFGGGGGARAQPKQQKGKDETYTIKATLQQMYSGFTKNMQLKRKVLCTSCKGLGAPASSITKCGGCKGTGRKVTIQRMGAMITQSQSTCNECHGKGDMLTGKKCTDCEGVGKSTVKKVLEVFVPKNSPNGYKVLFKGDGDEALNTIPGDVIFTIQVEEHSIFKRINDDLFMNLTITLNEALTGVKRVVEHLDKRKILILSNENQIIKPNSNMMIVDEGMPRRTNPCLRGNLIITFTVEFPKSLNNDLLVNLNKLLPNNNKKYNENDYEVHYLQPANESAFNQKEVPPKQRNQAYDYEDDYEDVDDHHHHRGGAQGVQCQQA